MEYKEKSLELNPELLEEEFVFCSHENSMYGAFKEMQPIASIQEKEGLTLVIPKKIADKNNISYESSYKCISIGLVTSLEGYGLTAIISKSLNQNQISANIFAGKYHDHIFVPSSKADQALLILNDLKNKKEGI
tara:strand:+ start:1051 stop:1452 length:402 start_codon:yes stop_codon:yes gene_type:complete